MGTSFSVDYDALARTSTVAGFRGACLGNGFVSGLAWNAFTVRFSETCPPPPGQTTKRVRRELELEGKFTGVDVKGAITVDVSPSRPSGKAHPAGNISSQVNGPNGNSIHTQIYDFHGPAIELKPPGGGMMSTGGHAASLVTMIDQNSYGACVFKEAGKVERTCRLSRGRSKIVKR